MGVHIYESGRKNQTAAVDDAAGVAVDLTERGDLAVQYGDIGLAGRFGRPVDNQCIPDDVVEHVSLHEPFRQAVCIILGWKLQVQS